MTNGTVQGQPQNLIEPIHAVAAGYQIFDLTWPLDFTSTSTIARS